jgi:SAM-dependent methyltransferase
MPLVPARLHPVVRRYRRHLRPSLAYKTRRATSVLEDFLTGFPSDAVILNVGAGATAYGKNVLNIEIAPGPGVDVVAVAENLPFADASCEGLILMAVLEHVQDAVQTLREARRVLVPGGRLLIDIPFIQGYHPVPADFRRFTEQGLRAEVARYGFHVESSGVAVGPASAMAGITAEFLALVFSAGTAAGYRIARLFTTWLALPIKYLDAWLDRHPMAYTIPSGVWVRARRA